MTNDQFKAWRKALGLTKKEAAKQLGISVASVSLYEAGKRFDNGNPVEVPRTVELACHNLSRRCLTNEAIQFSELWQACGRQPNTAAAVEALDGIVKRVENVLQVVSH